MELSIKQNNKAVILPDGVNNHPGCQSPPEIQNNSESSISKLRPRRTPEEMRQMVEQREKNRAAGLLKTPLEKFLDDPRPLRAIRRNCYECNGYSLPAVRNCKNKNCALWLFRCGTSAMTTEEYTEWQAAYRSWMEHIGEINSDAGENDNNEEDQ